MADTILKAGPNAAVILSIAIMLFAGFLLTRITKALRLPNVTGYIFAGIIIGPYVLHVIPENIISGMDFVTDIALSFIAFGVGKYFKLSALKKSGSRILMITFAESLTAAVVISLAMILIFRLPVSFSILLGAIGCATAPASTIMTIRQYKAKGEFVDTLLQVVALDDAVSLLAFSVCAAVTQIIYDGGNFNLNLVLLPVIWNLVSILIGALFGFLLSHLINDKRSQEHSLVLVTAFILTLTAFCNYLDISPLLGCMVLGTVYINLNGKKQLFKQVNRFTPPILLMFFVLSGMRLDVPSLARAGVIGVVYFVIRILGKYAGAYFGAALSHCSDTVKKYLGLALIPQAGVSIGLAALGQRLLPPELGTILSTIILSSAVLYEMIGPASAKASLFLAGVIERQEPALPPVIEKQDKSGKQ